MKSNFQFLSRISTAFSILTLGVACVGCMMTPSTSDKTSVASAFTGLSSLNQLPASWSLFNTQLHKAQSGISVAYSVSPTVAAQEVDRTVSLVFSGVTASDAKVSLSLTKGLSLVSGSTEWTLPTGQAISQVSIKVRGNGSDQGNLQYVNVFAGQNSVTNAMAVEIKIDGNTLNNKPANGKVETDNAGRKLLIMSSDK
jgi:hypothetical protein